MSSNSENQGQKIKDELTKFKNNLPSLKMVVKTSVDKTNHILSILESNKHAIDTKIDSFASSRLQPLFTKVKYAIEKTMVLYQHRQYYGPQIVAGAGASVGTLVTLRRGRIPGIFTGVFTGACVYAGVYGGPNVFPQNKE